MQVAAHQAELEGFQYEIVEIKKMNQEVAWIQQIHKYSNFQTNWMHKFLDKWTS